MRVVLTSGFFKSPHAIALLSELRNQGQDVCLCVCVRSFQRKRALQYLRHYGLATLWRKVRARMLSAPGGPASGDDTAGIRAFLRERNIAYPTVNAACAALGVDYLAVDDLNSPATLSAIRERAPELAVYSGGGILRKAFIACFPRGVLNAHSGPLPFFRGMNVLEWSLWHGVAPAVTIHYIHAGIDTGDILASRPVLVEPGDDLDNLRSKAIRIGVEALLEVAADLATFHAGRRIQAKSDGAQFFLMHPALKRILAARIAQGTCFAGGELSGGFEYRREPEFTRIAFPDSAS